MKKILFTSIFILITNLTFSQTENPKCKVVVNTFEKNYNTNNFETIFSMFSNNLKTAIPLDKATSFLTNLKTQAGNITNREFVKYKNGTYASYKTTFERVVLVLNISIDDNSKINGLFVKPFVEEVNSGNVINNLSSKDNLITKKQSKIIFTNSKSFPNQTQIAIAIINNGKVSYFGTKRNNDTISISNNHKSTFEIGSITKVFTSTLLSEFITNKKIKLNDNINDYLNLSFKNKTKISFKDLANHTSGLPRLPSNIDLAKVNPENPYKEYKEKELEEYLTNHIELSNKGKYQYSNLGVGLMGFALSKIENTTYKSLLEDKIFSKYEMQNSTVDINNVKGKLVAGINNEGNEAPNWEFSILAGAGGILSTIEDLSKFVIAQFNPSNKALKLTRQKTFQINDNMDIGLGWHLLKSQSKNIWYWHNGGTGGYSSSMAIDTKSKNGIIILSNVSAYNQDMENIDKLCFGLMKTL